MVWVVITEGRHFLLRDKRGFNFPVPGELNVAMWHPLANGRWLLLLKIKIKKGKDRKACRCFKNLQIIMLHFHWCYDYGSYCQDVASVSLWWTKHPPLLAVDIASFVVLSHWDLGLFVIAAKPRHTMTGTMVITIKCDGACKYHLAVAKCLKSFVIPLHRGNCAD